MFEFQTHKTTQTQPNPPSALHSNNSMSINVEKLITLALVLPVYLLISNEIMSTVAAIHIKSDGFFINTAMACAVTVLCTFNLCRTWLKILIITTSDIKDNDKKIIFVHLMQPSNEEVKDNRQEAQTQEAKKQETQQEAPSEPSNGNIGKPE